MKTSNQHLSDFVRTALSDIQAGPQFVKNVDFYIKRAVVNLQDQGMLPYLTESFVVRDKKGSVEYGKQTLHYVELPKDFAEIELFLVQGREQHQYVPDTHTLRESVASSGNACFTIDIADHTDRSKRYGRPVLFAYPFPKDDQEVKIKYMSNGTDIDLSQIDSVYFEPVLNEVMRIIGIRSPALENREAYSRSTRHKGPVGKRQANRTFPTTKPKYFANAPARKRRTRTISTRFSGLTYRNRDDK